MSGESLVNRSCPDCGATLESINDCFSGPVSALDNFDKVEDYLRDEGLLSDEDPLFARHDVTPEEVDVEPRDGPFVTESIVCTETWCSDSACDFSRRTYSPPSEVASDIVGVLTGELDDTDLSEGTRHEAEQLLASLDD